MKGSNSELRIDFLADVPEFVPALAHEMAEHWRHIIAGESYQRRLETLRLHDNHDLLPIAWVAHADGSTLGTSALRVCDLPGREDLSPWLAGVYVMRAHRGSGIASRLCKVAEKKAWDLGITRLYLHTPDQETFYRRLGWKRLGVAIWSGRETVIMVKERAIELTLSRFTDTKKDM